MLRVLGRILANAAALLATTVVPGITFDGGWRTLLAAGAILGLFNMVVRPIAVMLALPVLILSLGIFYFVLNALLLWLASLVLPGYRVSDFFAALAGGLVMTVANWAIHALFKREEQRR